jgi:tetratricopeptide (TPR) repeat protein
LRVLVWIAAGAAATALLWMLRDRSHLLGDGLVWLDNIRLGQFPLYSEPLASRTWQLYTLLLRGLGVPTTPEALAVLPIACGFAAGALLIALARTMTERASTFAVSAGLLLTLASGQLYFGYIEVYPIVSVAVLLYVLAGVWVERKRLPAAGAGVALSLALSAHLATVLLLPSYAHLILRQRIEPLRRLVLLVFPLLLTGLLLALLGLGRDDLLRPFAVASIAVRSQGQNAANLVTGVGAALGDWMNAVALVLPIPSLVFLARLFAPRTTNAVTVPVSFLAWAAVPGLFLAFLLAIPGSPAQDWDLLAVSLIPAALFCVVWGGPVLAAAGPAVHAGLIGMGLASLLTFAAVNASESNAERRFESLLRDDARLSPHERAYGREKLYRMSLRRGDLPRALEHAQRSVQAEPTNARFLVNEGFLLDAMGRTDEAIPILERAVQLNPNRWEARYDAGICYVKKERYAEAAGHLRVAVRLEENRPEVRHMLGIALYRGGHPDSAVAVWSEILSRWPEYARALQAGQGGAAPGGVVPSIERAPR